MVDAEDFADACKSGLAHLDVGDDVSFIEMLVVLIDDVGSYHSAIPRIDFGRMIAASLICVTCPIEQLTRYGRSIACALLQRLPAWGGEPGRPLA